MAVNRRRILELYDYGEGLSIRQISDLLGNSRNTIRKVIQQAGDLGITKELLKTEGGSKIDALFAQAGRADSDYEPLDYGYLSKELDSSGVNLKLLWTEYCQECASRKATPYQYSRFCALYKEWAKKANVTRRIIHKPSYACQVDWVGDTGEVCSRVTGGISKAYCFVMTMPYSGCMYVEAFPDMKMHSWIAAHNHAYRFFGGAPSITIPDNLRTGVRKSDPYEPLLNEVYEQMGDHFSTAIVPAKVYYPKGKAQVERTVKIVETWVVAYLRHKTFFSFSELNEAILERVDDLNEQVAKDREASRRELFRRDEAEGLLPLPNDDFEFATWRKAKLQQDSHFQFERMRYSAPAAYIGQDLDLRITSATVGVYEGGNLICIHKRLYGRIGQYSTVEEHMPEHLRTTADKLWSARGFAAWAHKVGPATEACVKAMLESRKIVEQTYRSCRGLRSLCDRKGPQALEAACAQALELVKTPSYTQIKNLIAKAEDAPALTTDQDRLVRGAIGSIGYLRDPSDYANHLRRDDKDDDDERTDR